MKISKQQNLQGFWAGERFGVVEAWSIRRSHESPRTDTPRHQPPANHTFPGKSLLLRVPELHTL